MDEIKFYLLALTAAFIACICPHVHAETVSDSFELKPYAGAELQRRYTGHEAGSGANMLEKKLFSQHGFLGLKLNEFLAFETGYHQGKSDKNPLIGAELSHAGHHVDVVGILPLGTMGMDLFAGYGVSFLKITYKHQKPFEDKHRSNKSMPRAMAGAHLPLTESWKLRGSIIWENTKKMQFRNCDQHKAIAENIRPLDTLTMGLGLVHEF